MARQNISTGSPYEESIGFSRAVKIGNMLAVSGTAPIKPGGSTACVGDVYEQTKYCLGIIERAIKEAGGTLDNVIRTRIMMRDISQWQEAGRAHGEFFGQIKPASTFFQASSFINEEWLVMIEADCYVEGWV
ncbi:MAG: RidA family protein [candidate division Zixibacteria bacterium]|nr:RidA family protein [candidate division Zixibacteria bacterium]